MTAQKPILFSDVISPLLIKKNDKVNIHYHKNGISIETIGIALEDAGAGDMVKVKNIDSNKVVVAKVKSAGVVEVG
jgi:flagella basal body P-ring formation protein FlgA